MLFHVWFSTKKRKEALQGEIRDLVLEGFKRVALENGIELIESDAQFDHVHMLLRIPTEEELPNTMRLLKGITSREVFLAEPMLRFDMGTLAFWQKSFGRRPVPEDQLEVVREYIRTQLDRPLRHVE